MAGKQYTSLSVTQVSMNYTPFSVLTIFLFAAHGGGDHGGGYCVNEMLSNPRLFISDMIIQT